MNFMRLGSNHDLIAGTITALNPEAPIYTVCGWTWWEKYAEEKPEFNPNTHNEGYSQLTQ